MSETVRHFDETSPGAVLTSVGGCESVKGAMTLVALVRLPTKPASTFKKQFFQICNSAKSGRGPGLLVSEPGEIRLGYHEAAGNTEIVSATEFFTFDSHWKLVVAKKPAGKSKVTFELYDFTTKTWKRGTSSTEASDPDEAFPGGIIQFGRTGAIAANKLNNGDLAACAVFKSQLSQVEVESLIATTIGDWSKLNPAGFWEFGQVSTGESVEDLTGNGANQTQLIATTSVLVEDPPIPYGLTDSQVYVLSSSGLVVAQRQVLGPNGLVFG